MFDPAIPEPLRKTKCVVVYSNSYGIAKEGLAAHLFFMLTTPAPSEVLKRIITNLNLLTPTVHAWLSAQPLPEGKTDMPMPIDPTMGQNNRIIYNARPVLHGIDDPLPTIEDRIWLYVPDRDPTNRLSLHDVAFAAHRRTNGGEAVLGALRKAKGMPPVASINGRSVDASASDVEWTITDIQRDSSEFIRCNVNGTARSPWFFKNGPITEKSLMYSQNPADLPFFIAAKAPKFTAWWNGTDDSLGQWARMELEILDTEIGSGIMEGAAKTPPDFMRK